MSCLLLVRSVRFTPDRTKQCARYATITEEHHVGCGFGRIELLADSTFAKLCARKPGTLTWRGFCATT